MAAVGVYKFTKEIQRRILSLLWLDHDSWRLYHQCILPRYFEDDIHIDICGEIYRYYDKYDTLPTYEIVRQQVLSLTESSKIKKQRQQEYEDELEALRDYDFNEIAYLRDQIVIFARRQAMSGVLSDAVDTVVAGKPMDKLLYDVAEALSIGTTKKQWVNPLDETYIRERFEHYATGEDVVERIPTGLTAVDSLMHGGLARGELGVILAPPGRGKTTTLINIGVGALRAGYNLVHITFENDDQQTIRNYDCCLLKREKSVLGDPDMTDKLVKSMNYMAQPSFGFGQMRVIKFAVKSMTVTDLNMEIKELIAQERGNFTPDVIVVDYGGLVKPENGGFDKRFQLESIFEGLRGMAEEFKAAVWSGAQGNRESLSKRIVTKADLAEAFAIANVVDFMMALCQTARERTENKMRFFVTKQREERDNVLLAGSVNYAAKTIEVDGEISQFTDNKEDDDDDVYPDD